MRLSQQIVLFADRFLVVRSSTNKRTVFEGVSAGDDEREPDEVTGLSRLILICKEKQDVLTYFYEEGSRTDVSILYIQYSAFAHRHCGTVPV